MYYPFWLLSYSLNDCSSSPCPICVLCQWHLYHRQLQFRLLVHQNLQKENQRYWKKNWKKKVDWWSSFYTTVANCLCCYLKHMSKPLFIPTEQFLGCIWFNGGVFLKQGIWSISTPNWRAPFHMYILRALGKRCVCVFLCMLGTNYGLLAGKGSTCCQCTRGTGLYGGRLEYI